MLPKSSPHIPTKSTLILLLSVVILSLPFPASPDTSPPSYVVQKASGRIVIDGRLDEACWAKVPAMEFRELQHGSEPPWPCSVKILWDDSYFYLGFSIDDPDVWAELTPDMPEARPGKDNKNEYIMTTDGFGKIFFDPDGDGKNYCEVHVNALNKVDDGFLAYPYLIQGRKHGWQTEFDYEGLKTAVFVDGTVNDQSGGFDRGWSIEVAFPWASLDRFIEGSCPPEYGDTWRAHFGRVWKRHPRGDNHYYTWPVIGFVDCHILNRWGYITFAKEFPEIEY